MVCRPVADSADPLPTLTTANRGELAFITAQFGGRAGQAPRLHDEQDYEFAGTKTQRSSRSGNAVSVAKMKACVSAIMADAAEPSRSPVVRRAAE